ncbi:CATRA system-associated protein [Streptomyces sp. NPDC086549]|uniref:CATRA system-associated protein n=1 Tax=Streptomyces sp. NPDC086549 TaxID=3365752 RepID=UPI00382CD977
MSAPIGRELAREVQQALRALLDWRLPPDAWDETGRLLTELGAAVGRGDAETLDALTARLETSGRRVLRMGSGAQELGAADGKVAAPQPIRERAVAVLHALERPSGPGRGDTGAAAGGARPSRT